MTLRTIFAAIFLAASLPSLSAVAAGSDLARQDYMLNCQGCHLADGSGSPGKVPGMNGFLGYFLHVPGGREFIIRVPGVAHSVLDDDRLAGVMNWVLENFSPEQLPDGHQPFSATEIGMLRKDALLDVGPRRAELLRAIEKELGVRESGDLQ